MFIVTNNNLVTNEYESKTRIIYLADNSYLQVLYFVRDMVHKGHKLITHPLAGSLKPNETPFRSIVLNSKIDSLDFESLSIIEASIESAEKFINGKAMPRWTEKILQDFRLIDNSLIRNALENMYV